MVKALISVDAEGLQGITFGEEVLSSGRDYEIGRKMMTLAANAVVEGVIDGGADEVLIVDSHNGNRNINLGDLDSRAELIQGFPKPLSMVEGVEQSARVLLLGYHSKAGTLNGVLNHTYSTNVHRLSVNGVEVGEIWLSTAVAGHFNKPVVFLAGDKAAVEEGKTIIPGAEFVSLKRGISRYAAQSYPLTETIKELREKSAKSMGLKISPLKTAGHLEMMLEFQNTGMADACMTLSEIRRVDGYTVGWTSKNPLDAYNTFRVLVLLATFDQGGY
ncbi:MAG TPA: M55 family metallopeptidase [Thermoplasmataceae archaeon]|nr:M55 family metallopeptidase [Thermoplasmataceae archaeon]